MSNDRPILTVIMPAFNEEGVIATTLKRLREAVLADDQLRGRVEVVVISDGSGDNTYEEARAALDADLPGQVVQLVTNVGSHAAVRSGLKWARGQHVAILASDGQDPPELLAEMLAAMQPGVDIVWGERAARGDDATRVRLLSRVYYWLFRKLTGMDYPPKGYDFVMITRRVLDAMLSYRERNASIFLLIFNLGFGQTSIRYDRGPRAGGESRWTFRRRLKLGIDMITAFTAAPIRLVSVIGLVFGFLGVVFGGFTVVRALLSDAPPDGWASLMVMTSLMGGTILIALALIGEYLWRTLDEVRARPMYLEADHAAEPPRQAGPEEE